MKNLLIGESKKVTIKDLHIGYVSIEGTEYYVLDTDELESCGYYNEIDKAKYHTFYYEVGEDEERANLYLLTDANTIKRIR